MQANASDRVVGNYRLLEKLRELPYGDVYRATHTNLGSILILKVLAPELACDETAVGRFKQAARTMARLQHDSLVHVLDIGSDAGLHFFAEEMIEATSLATLLATRGHLSAEQVIAVGRAVARALAGAHAAAVQHGALSPRSILVDQARAGMVVVADVAVRTVGEAPQRAWLGPYTAPEVPTPADTGAMLDPRVDVYAVGAVLYEMSRGQAPAGPSATAPSGSHTLADVIARAMQPNPGQRQQTMKELLGDLKRCEATDVDDTPTMVTTWPTPEPVEPEAAHDEPAAEPAPSAEQPVVAPEKPSEPAAGLGVVDLRLDDEDDGWEAGPPPESPAPAPTAGAAEPSPRPRVALIAGGLAAVLMLAVAGYRLIGGPAPEPQRAASPPPTSPMLATPTSTAPVATAPVPAAPGLGWAQLAPEAPDQTVVAGRPLSFRATASGTGDVRYRWFVAGVQAADGPTTFEFRGGRDDVAQTREVTARASDGDRSVEHSWHVRVDAPPPPAIARVSPSAATVHLKPGTRQEFAVAAATQEGAPLVYTWLRDGTVVASGPEPRWTLDSPADGEVAVTATDAFGLRSGPQTWSVVVEKPVVANHPPRIAATAPPTGAPITVAPGGSVEFQVRAQDADAGDRLSYRWLLDDRPVATEPQWRFVARGTDTAGGSHHVEARVSDGHEGDAASVAWDVEVRAALQIVRVRPATEHVAVPEGQVAELVVGPAAPETAGRLRYSWSVDGRLVESSAEGRFRLDRRTSAGTHQVSVVAAEPGGAPSAPQSWVVDVLAGGAAAAAEAPAPTPPVPVRPPPVAEGGAPAGGITEAEARDWVDRFRAAWQALDVRALRRLGAVTSEAQETAMRQALAASPGLQVTVRNELIRVDGRGATVSLERVEGAGRAGAREVYRLERTPEGVMAVTKPSPAR